MPFGGGGRLGKSAAVGRIRSAVGSPNLAAHRQNLRSGFVNLGGRSGRRSVGSGRVGSVHAVGWLQNSHARKPQVVWQLSPSGANPFQFASWPLPAGLPIAHRFFFFFLIIIFHKYCKFQVFSYQTTSDNKIAKSPQRGYHRLWFVTHPIFWGFPHSPFLLPNTAIFYAFIAPWQASGWLHLPFWYLATLATSGIA